MSNDTDTRETVMHRLREHRALRKGIITLVVGMLLLSGVGPMIQFGGVSLDTSPVSGATAQTSSEWTNQTNLSSSYDYVRAEEVNGDLFAVAGQSSYADILRYESGGWVQVANIPNQGIGTAVAASSGSIYLIGGPNDMDKLTEYDVSSDTVTTLSNMPTGRQYVSATVLNGQIYVPGGYDSNFNTLGSMSIYDISSGTWSGASNVPYSVAGYGLASSDSKMYMYGGYDGSGSVASSYIYHPSNTTWTQTAPMQNGGRDDFAGTYYDSRPLAAGGGREGTRLDTIAGFSGGLWSNYTSLPFADNNFGIEEHGEDLWIVGLGGNGVYSFNPGSQPSLSGTVTDLSLDTRAYLQPNQTVPYAVRWNETNTTTGESTVQDVTANATVTSGNTSVLTVDLMAATLTATNDTSVAATVPVTANYTTPEGDELETTANVTVAALSAENLEIIPNNTWRFAALFGFGAEGGDGGLNDPYMMFLLIATFAAVAAARFASAFAGLGLGTLVITIGWFSGYVGFGMAAVSVFIALFIGLNLAANIDYMGGGMRR